MSPSISTSSPLQPSIYLYHSLSLSLWRTEVFPPFSVTIATLQQEKKDGLQEEKRCWVNGDVWTMLMLLQWSSVVCSYILFSLFYIITRLYHNALVGVLSPRGFKISTSTHGAVVASLIITGSFNRQRWILTANQRSATGSLANIDKHPSVTQCLIMSLMERLLLSHRTMNDVHSLGPRQHLSVWRKVRPVRRGNRSSRWETLKMHKFEDVSARETCGLTGVWQRKRWPTLFRCRHTILQGRTCCRAWSTVWKC